MSKPAQDRWLVAYDIRDPKRLSRMYRFLSKHALPLQYSVFLAHTRHGQIDDLLDGVRARINPAQDDVRAYHLTGNTKLWAMGNQFAADDATLTDEALNALRIDTVIEVAWQST